MCRVSIGIPVYNGSKYIAEAIESILAQTYRDFEVVVADNASTDDTREIVRAIAKHDPRVRLIERKENAGPVDNFNFVFHESKGEYFKWAAADDLCAPEFLQECVAALDAHPEAAWGHCTSDKIDRFGNSLLHRIDKNDPEIIVSENGVAWCAPPRKDCQSQSPASRFTSVLLGTNWCVDSYGLFRRSALEKTRLYVDIYGAEKVLLAELALLGSYVHIPKQLFSQRIHMEASSAIESKEELEEFVAPQRKRPFFSTRLSLLKAHTWSVLRQRIGLWQKVKGLFGVTRYLFQFHKWGRIVRNAFMGKGHGGGGARLLKQVDQHQESKQ